MLRYKSGEVIKFLDVSNSRLWPEDWKGEIGVFLFLLEKLEMTRQEGSDPFLFGKNVDFELRGVEPLMVAVYGGVYLVLIFYLLIWCNL